MTVIAVLATIFGIASGFANLPQAYRIFKRKSAKDISIITYLILLTGSIIWVLYGLEINSFPITIANMFGSINLGVVILGWFFYGREVK